MREWKSRSDGPTAHIERFGLFSRVVVVKGGKVLTAWVFTRRGAEKKVADLARRAQ